MKKLLSILILVFLLTTSCTRLNRVQSKPSDFDLPCNFSFISDEGHGYFKYKSPDGYFLVYVQKQGTLQIGATNRFIDIVYIGKE